MPTKHKVKTAEAARAVVYEFSVQVAAGVARASSLRTAALTTHSMLLLLPSIRVSQLGLGSGLHREIVTQLSLLVVLGEVVRSPVE